MSNKQELAARMVFVADELEAFSREEYGFATPEFVEWSPARLRHEAVVITDIEVE